MIQVHGGQLAVTIVGVACLAAAAFIFSQVSPRAFWAFGTLTAAALASGLAVALARTVRAEGASRAPRR